MKFLYSPGWVLELHLTGKESVFGAGGAVTGAGGAAIAGIAAGVVLGSAGAPAFGGGGLTAAGEVGEGVAGPLAVWISLSSFAIASIAD